MANSNKDNKLSKFKFTGTGLEPLEYKWAKKLFNAYRQNYHIDTLSDLQLLEELVYREALQERYKQKMKDIADSATVKEKNIIPKYILNELDENFDKIIIIKERLKLFEDKKEQDAFKHIQTLRNKFNRWLEENQGSRTLICPHCANMILLKIRTEAWEAQKHSMFRDRILCNDHLVKMFLEERITKLDCAKVLGVSEDYIDWLIEKWYSNEK